MADKKPLAPSAATVAATNPSDASPSPSTGKVLSFSATTATGQGLSTRQAELLEKRGIDVEMATAMGWRTATRSGSGEAIEIPYYRDGMEVNCKTRTLEGDKRFSQREGAEKRLYNLDVLKEIGHNPLIITEGEMDCMIALQCGFTAVSVPDGAPKQQVGDKESVKYDYLADVPKNIERIILATDNDNPGHNLMHDLALRLGRHRCLWITYPEGCKDLNEVFLQHGSQVVKDAINNAQFMKIEGLWRLSEMTPLPCHPALDTGVDNLAQHFKMRLGDFSVFTGVPSHGKTTLVNQIAFNMAWKYGWNVCFASFEQNPQTEHRRALRTLYNEKPEWKQDEKEIAAADKFLDENFSFIVPTDDLNEWADMTWLKDRMIAAVTRFNAKLIVIDPWNELDHLYDSRAISLTQYVGRSIKELKRFAQKYLVHILVIAHPAKLQKLKDGTYPIPTAYDISDSSHWYNKPEQIVVVHRLDAEKSLIRVAKSRYHQILGKPGDVELNFNMHNYQYEKVVHKPY